MNSFFFLHLLYIGLFLSSNEGRGVSFVTDGIVGSVLMNLNYNCFSAFKKKLIN